MDYLNVSCLELTKKSFSSWKLGPNAIIYVKLSIYFIVKLNRTFNFNSSVIYDRKLRPTSPSSIP